MYTSDQYVNGAGPAKVEAQDLVKLGYKVFPIGTDKRFNASVIYALTGQYGWKSSVTSDPDIVAKWFEIDPSCGYGIVNDDLLVLDIDMGAAPDWCDQEQWAELVDIAGKGGAAKTPSGTHIYMRRPDSLKNRGSLIGKIAACVDIKTGEGSYVVGPGSYFKGDSKKQAGWYSWDGDNRITKSPHNLPEAPAWLVEWILEASAAKAIRADGGANGDDAGDDAGTLMIPDGRRSDTLFRIACNYRGTGSGEAVILAAIAEHNRNRCDPPLDDAELRSIAKSAAKYQPSRARALPGILGNIINGMGMGGIEDELDGLDREPPIDDPLANFKPFPVTEVLPGGLDDLCISIASVVSVDPATVGMLMIGMLSGALGASRRLRITNNFIAHGTIWAAVVLPSGARKSPPIEILKAPFLDANKAAEEAWLRAMNQHRRRKQDAGEGAFVGPEPVRRYVMVNDWTSAALKAVLSNNPKGLCVIEEELEAIYKLSDSTGGDKDADRVALQKYYDGEQSEVIRKGESAMRSSPFPLVAITGMVQPTIMNESMGVKETSSGFLFRFMVVRPPIPRPFLDRDAKIAGLPLWNSVVNALLSLPGYACKSDIPKHDLDVEALEYFLQEKNRRDLEVFEIKSDRIRGMKSKIFGTAARWALVHHMVKQAIAGNLTASIADLQAALHGAPGRNEKRLIGLDSVRAGFTFAEWVANQALSTAVSMANAAEQAEFDKMIVWMKQAVSDGHGPIKLRDFNRKFHRDCERVNRKKPVDGARTLLEQMTSYGLIRKAEGGLDLFLPV